MEHPFFPTTTTRAEALRWLTISEKLLSARDLMGSKSFATRARDSDPTLTPADQILAVVDTLLAGDRRIGNNQQDWYAILRLTPQQGRDPEAVASQYRNLAIVLNPQKNKFPFADQAFRSVVEAWSVLSNPTRKSMYDKEISFYLQPLQQPPPQPPLQPDPYSNPLPAMHQNFIFYGGSSSSGLAPQQHSSGVPFSQVQVHASSQVDPVSGGSTQVPHNFMSFTSGTSLAFGGASGSKVSSETVNKQAQEGVSSFTGNAAAQNYSVVNEKTSHDVNASENVEERPEVEEVEEEEDEEEVGEDMEGADEQEERVSAAGKDDDSTFWTACPYCYYMYEYPMLYSDCTLRCQNCKRAFQAVIIPSPPPMVDGQDGYFCCWGFLPLGFSMENWEKNKGAASTWTPFSPMFNCPGGGMNKKFSRKIKTPRVYVDEDEVLVEISESSGSSDDDWKAVERRKKKASNVKGKGASGTPSKSARKAQVDKGKNVTLQDSSVPPNGVETPNKTAGEPSKKVPAANSRKQPARVAKNFEKLDLNVEFSNEAEEPAAPRVNQGHGPSRGEDDNIEGIGFFEGLDEFLSSLPILNVVGDDKVVKAA